MPKPFYFIEQLDWILVSSAFILSLFGLIAIFSYGTSSGDFLNFKKQVVFLVVGIFLMLVLSSFDWRILKNNSYLILFIYFISVLSLVGIFFLAPKTRGSLGWYKLGPLNFDPVEPTKLAIILLLAKFFSQRHIEMYNLKHIILSGFYVALPAILIALQPNMGSALILILVWIGILFVSGIRLRHFLILCLVFLIIFSLGWNFFLQDYQRNRILSFFSPEKYYLGASWSQIQSKIAIGSGGFWGKGFGKGSQLQGGFLPEAHNDFIFSAIAEETGLIGVLILLSAMFLLLHRIFKIIAKASNNFVRLFASGIIILLISQSFINIGMALAILPVIGISLPLVSYGGSGLIFTYISLGLLQSMRN